MHVHRWGPESFLVVRMRCLHWMVPCWRSEFDILGVWGREVLLLELRPRSGSEVSLG